MRARILLLVLTASLLYAPIGSAAAGAVGVQVRARLPGVRPVPIGLSRPPLLLPSKASLPSISLEAGGFTSPLAAPSLLELPVAAVLEAAAPEAALQAEAAAEGSSPSGTTSSKARAAIISPKTVAPGSFAGIELAAPADGARIEALSADAARMFDGNAAAQTVSLPGPRQAAPADATAEPAPTPRVLKRPVRILITGPPGSGKGTYSKLLSQDYGIPHISVGALLRDYAKDRPEIAAVMARGELVDTRLVLGLIEERLSRPDVLERGFILDGFPRRLVEARALKKILEPQGALKESPSQVSAGVDAMIVLDVPETELLRRIKARGRTDDTPEVFRDRMRIYREQTVPSAEIFSDGPKVLTPEVSGSDIETNYARVRSGFEAWVDGGRLLSVLIKKLNDR